MNRDEWILILNSVPLTPNQLGAIHRHFERLGFHETQDRAERLRLTAALAGVPELGSVKDLTQGQAGRALGALGGCRARPDLDAAARNAVRNRQAAELRHRVAELDRQARQGRGPVASARALAACFAWSAQERISPRRMGS